MCIRDRQSCVTGSVEGVNTALIIVAPNTTYFHAFNICLPFTIPANPKMTCTIGTWKEKPVL